MLGAKKEAKFVEYRVNDAKLQKMLDLADNLIQPKTRQESRLQRYWQSVAWKHVDKKILESKSSQDSDS